MYATAIIADDEPLLRAELREALREAWPDLVIVAEAGNGAQALEAVAAVEPDLVFLDVQMPRLGGVEVARRLRDQVLVVFLTAFEEYAVRAFEQRAVDYLVKPLDVERLADTVQRLQHLIMQRRPDARERVAQALEPPAAPRASPLEWLKVSSGSTIRLLPVSEVYLFRAVPGYTQIVTKDAEHFIETPLCDLLERLDAQRFVRVHRSAIVNLGCIAVIHKLEHGRLQIALKDGRGSVEVSRARSGFFRET
ncbi:MAG: response regulator [Rhodocyclales bacterium]|nr:response regulator [Rhodocyclales bacterium]